MLTDIILPIATPVFTLLALFIALFTWRANMRASRNIQHYTLVTKADSMLAGKNEFLRFMALILTQ